MKAAVIVLPLFFAGCNDASATATVARPAAPKTAIAASAAVAAAAQAADPQFTGTVVETMDAGQYTYLRLKTRDGDIWAAVTQQALKSGSMVTVGNAMWMHNFESKTLKRTFEHILFGSIIDPLATAGALPPGHPPTGSSAGSNPGSSAAPSITDIKVDKAPGKDARTIAEIYEAGASLKGVDVVVRGRVVKWNPEIMGRNWIHLQDGTGSADRKDNDITVTTSDVVAKGDVVTVRGKITRDKDFGAGYAYSVIIEDAKIVK